MSGEARPEFTARCRGCMAPAACHAAFRCLLRWPLPPKRRDIEEREEKSPALPETGKAGLAQEAPMPAAHHQDGAAVGVHQLGRDFRAPK